MRSCFQVVTRSQWALVAIVMWPSADVANAQGITPISPPFGVVGTPAGFDLLTSIPPAEVFGNPVIFDPDGPSGNPPIPMQGLPLGAFDFGGTIGVVPTGDADTIIRRTSPLLYDDAPVPIEIVALQLVSTTPISLSPFGADVTDFLVLSLDDGGFDPSVGNLAANNGFFPIQSFCYDSNCNATGVGLELNYALRQGTPDGPILATGSDTMHSFLPSGNDPRQFAPWAYDPDLATGQLIDKNSNIAFFSVIGTEYGGDGINNFGLPDMTGALEVAGVNDGFFPLPFLQAGDKLSRSVRVAAPVIPGDFDGDGDVDGNDLTDSVEGWETRFGVDLDGNNFLEWQFNFGLGVPPLLAVQAVAEPSSMALLLGFSIFGVFARLSSYSLASASAETSGVESR